MCSPYYSLMRPLHYSKRSCRFTKRRSRRPNIYIGPYTLDPPILVLIVLLILFYDNM